VLDADGSADADGLSDIENPYAFTGRRLDLESGLMQYRNRYYHTGLGRFISRDPEGYGDGYGLHVYVSGRPTHGQDAMGFEVLSLQPHDLESIDAAARGEAIAADAAAREAALQGPLAVGPAAPGVDCLRAGGALTKADCRAEADCIYWCRKKAKYRFALLLPIHVGVGHGVFKVVLMKGATLTAAILKGHVVAGFGTGVGLELLGNHYWLHVCAKECKAKSHDQLRIAAMRRCTCEVLVGPPQDHLTLAMDLIWCGVSTGVTSSLSEYAFLWQLRE